MTLEKKNKFIFPFQFYFDCGGNRGGGDGSMPQHKPQLMYARRGQVEANYQGWDDDVWKFEY